jgi:hypothetical protein
MSAVAKPIAEMTFNIKFLHIWIENSIDARFQINLR